MPWDNVVERCMSIAGPNHITLSGRSKRAAVCGAVAACIAAGGLAATVTGCGGDGLAPPDSTPVEVSSISIDGGSFNIERGFHRVITAAVKDKNGKTITVPLVWRSTDEKVATIDQNGRLTAVDTGLTAITASSLGVTSQGIGVRV